MFPRVRPARVRAAAAVVVAAALLAGCAGTGNQGGPSGSDNRYVAGDGGAKLISDRQAPPTASGTTLDGRPVALTDYRGRVVVVNFWASWCAPCRAEAPALERLAQANQAAGVQFLGVGIKDSKAGLEAFQRTFGTSYPSLFDPDGKVTLDFGVVPPSAVPSTLILDRRGRVAVRIIGPTTYSRLGPLIDQVVAER